jgi:hypothetical protein
MAIMAAASPVLLTGRILRPLVCTSPAVATRIARARAAFRPHEVGKRWETMGTIEKLGSDGKRPVTCGNVP